MKKFDIEEMYKDYLKLSKLDENKMSEHERRERRHTFYGAIGQFIVAMLHYPKEAADDDFAKAMDSALAQVTEHFKDSIMSFQVKQPNVNYPYPIYYKEGEKPN